MPCKGYKHTAEALAKMSAVHKGQKLNKKQKQALIKSNRERVYTPEMRKIMSDAQKGKKLSAETKAKISAGGRGLKRSDETKKRMSIAQKKRTFGPLSEEHKNNISKAHKGRVKSDEERRHLSESHKGLKLSDETKAKISSAHTGKVLSDEHKQHLSEAGMGRIVSEETREKLTGENNPNWSGGMGYEPYPPIFNEPLKRKIRERDNNTCQKCGRTKIEEGKNLAVHHIDYNKYNCSEYNLITLCGSCNNKVNTNREDWTEYFQNVMLNVV